METWWDRKWIMNCNCSLIYKAYMDFRSFLFVCTSYKATFLNRSDNTLRHPRLHILSPFPPSSALPAIYFPCRMTSQTWQPPQSRAFLRRQHACLHEIVFWKILHCFVLSARSRACVCVHRRVVTYSGHFLLCYIHDLCSLFTWDLLL